MLLGTAVNFFCVQSTISPKQAHSGGHKILCPVTNTSVQLLSKINPRLKHTGPKTGDDDDDIILTSEIQNPDRFCV